MCRFLQALLPCPHQKEVGNYGRDAGTNIRVWDGREGAEPGGRASFRPQSTSEGSLVAHVFRVKMAVIVTQEVHARKSNSMPDTLHLL